MINSRKTKQMESSPEQEHPRKAIGWAARDTSGVLSPFKFSRRETGATDVRFKVLYCGVCHSDIHVARNEWGLTPYPVVPGHELVGIVTEVGCKVQKFKVGDKVAVGCLVDSDRTCEYCIHHLENYCPNQIQTYGSIYYDGTMTYGGYSNNMVADEHFIVRIPDNMPLDGAAPLLCAGITTYSALRYYGLDKPCMHLGVNGLGGLGHLAVKFGKALGLKVTVISTSPNKKKAAMEHLGADVFLLGTDQDQMEAAMGTMDGIIDTVPAVRPLEPLIQLLKTNGKVVTLGITVQPLDLPVFPLIIEEYVDNHHDITGRKMVAGSAIGGMKETQEMINFAAEHNITADIEVIPIDYVNTAMERVVNKDVKFRFVIDIENTLKP